MKHDRDKAVEKFKIDLIVWKYCSTALLCPSALKFKIDLIVWKY